MIMMKVRRARREDIRGIQNLISSNTVPRDFRGKSGLVEYPMPSAKLLSKMVESELFLVCEREGCIAGFLGAYTDKFLETLPTSELSYLILIKKRPLVYGEIIVVDANSRGSWIPSLLFDSCFEIMHNSGIETIYGAIAHFPFRNAPSIGLVKRLEFKLVEEFTDSKGLEFGIYKKTLL
jgi:hypothetical protein